MELGRAANAHTTVITADTQYLDGPVSLCCCVNLPLHPVEGYRHKTVLMSIVDDLNDFHRHGG